MSGVVELNHGFLLFSASIISVMLLANRVLPRVSAAVRQKFSQRFIRAPVAKKLTDTIFFGVNPRNPEEFRGNGAMDPPLERTDYYNWLRDETRKKPEVLTHLKAENDFTNASLAHLSPLQDELYKDMLSHLKETDADVPYRRGGFMYYSRTQEGLSYRIHCRKAVGSEVEEVILDENEKSKGHDYTDIGNIEVSPSHQKLAYSVDYTGYETYAIHIVADIGSGAEAADILTETSGTVVWGSDDSVVFYMKMDSEHRPDRLFMHVLGTPQSEDVLILEESDGRFWMGAGKSADDKYLVVAVESKETTEAHAIQLHGVSGGKAHQLAVQAGNMQCIKPRIEGVRYDVEHHEGFFYCITNEDGAKNNKLTRCPTAAYFPQNEEDFKLQKKWIDVRPYCADEQLDFVIPFINHLAIFGRKGGTKQLWTVPMSAGATPGDWQSVPFSEVVYSLRAKDNYVYETSTLRLVYSSMLTPRQVIDFDMSTGKKEVLKEQEVPAYDRSQYECMRIYAPSADGSRQIPMSVVFSKKLLAASQQKSDGGNVLPISKPAATILYGYGSYGACMDPSFDYRRSTLLDRGVVYVIAHIRGGGEMGRYWYEDEGKYLTKRNTFEDFGACAQHLIDCGSTTAEQLCCVGRSAGGLLIGATVNMFPHLFKAAVADVPFVDVLNTMCDPTIPLTVTEWEEWGNPNLEKYHDYMLSYSPYENVAARDYPSMLVTAGLNDPRVAYWEPAKWVAKLRELKTDENPLYLKTDMSSGHFSASDRYKHIKETAFEYSFILDQIGAKDII